MALNVNSLNSNDNYCKLCIEQQIFDQLATYLCKHCQTSMCNECFHQHTYSILDEYNHVRDKFKNISVQMQNKRQLLDTFKGHCIKSVDQCFEEAIQDLHSLRKECTNYVDEQFNNMENVITEFNNELNPITEKLSLNWSRDGTSNIATQQINNRQNELSLFEKKLEQFTPNLELKISTMPRNLIKLKCALITNTNKDEHHFIPKQAARLILTRCTCYTTDTGDKVDVETQMEELSPVVSSTKDVQTDTKMEDINKYITAAGLISSDNGDDDDDFYSIYDEGELNNKISNEHFSSSKYEQSTIVTQNEVDRIASDGCNFLYFSDTCKSLCYVYELVRTSTMTTKEITIHWRHKPLLDLIWCDMRKQYLCATKQGIYSCECITNDHNTIDVNEELTQNWSYVRLSAIDDTLVVWSDTTRSSELNFYNSRTFEHTKSFNLQDYSRFRDNSTSFCVYKNSIATLFQFKQHYNQSSKKVFHITLCDMNLTEKCTLLLGECDIDHEIRAETTSGTLFITNGKKKLWIVSDNGTKKEYVRLQRIGRALAPLKDKVLIANGTQELQCITLKRT